MIRSILLVFLGGGLGSVLRLAVYRLARLWLPPDFPWGTFAVNVLGGLAAGLIFGWLLSRSEGGSDSTSLFLITGVMGGFTTFSAFGIDAVLLWRGDQLSALLYVLSSVLLALLGVVTGMAVARAF